MTVAAFEADVAVVGAGISGLACAFHLKRQARRVVLFEASARAGGKVGTRRVGGYLLEEGPNGFLNREPAMLELIEALGLSARLRPAAEAARARYVVQGGRPVQVPRGPWGLVTTPLISPGDKLRLLLEPLLARRGDGDEPLSRFASRHVGARLAHTLVDAVQTGIYAGDVDRLSAGATFPSLTELERKSRSLFIGAVLQAFRAARAGDRRASELPRGLCTFDEGLTVLTRALARELAAELRLSAPIRALAPRGGGWEVTADGQPSVRVRDLVLALPPYAAAELVVPHSAALAHELSSIPYAPLTVVHLGYPSVPTGAPRGFGVLAPRGEGLPVLGVIDVAATFPFRAPGERGLFTCLVGGAREPAAAALPDGELVKRARSALDALFSPLGEPELAEFVRWPRAIPQYEVGHLARVARIRELSGKIPGLHLVGNAYEGIGLNDCVRNARRAAEGLAAASQRS